MQARCAPGKMRSKLRVYGGMCAKTHLHGLARSRMETWAPAAAIEIRYEALRAGHGPARQEHRLGYWRPSSTQHAAPSWRHRATLAAGQPHARLAFTLPLTFSLRPGYYDDVVVPAGTHGKRTAGEISVEEMTVVLVLAASMSGSSD